MMSTSSVMKIGKWVHPFSGKQSHRQIPVQ